MKQGFFTPPDGWIKDDAEVARFVNELPMAQGCPATFADVHPVVKDNVDKPVYFWEAEKQVLGNVQPSWNQRQIGACVSFAYGRGVNDLIIMASARGEIQYPKYDVATEPIYGGSRVEVGGGRIRGDGSVGAWAAKWVMLWGILLRTVYGDHDLREYDQTRCRQYGRDGCPDDLEPIAKQFPVRSAALCQSKEEFWAGVGNGYPLAVCSNIGFASPYRNGFCEPNGTWNHAMVFRGRVVANKRGVNVKAGVLQNSWSSYIEGDPHFKDQDGNLVELPEGSFLVDWDIIEEMVRQGDSFFLSDIKGFPRRNPMDWGP